MRGVETDGQERSVSQVQSDQVTKIFSLLSLLPSGEPAKFPSPPPLHPAAAGPDPGRSQQAHHPPREQRAQHGPEQSLAHPVDTWDRRDVSYSWTEQRDDIEDDYDKDSEHRQENINFMLKETGQKNTHKKTQR